MRCLAVMLAAASGVALVPTVAVAGPPFETDDPEPTDLGHFEIYSFTSLEGASGGRSAGAGFDLNYGPVEDLQLTATLPLGYDRAKGSGHWSGGVSDLEVGAKYRFFKNEKRGQSIAVFPRVILPTARKGMSTGRTRLLLPVWGQQDIGKWSVFGGGGYELNPGEGNRNFWQAGITVTRDVGRGISLGGEITRQGPDADDTETVTSLGIGSIVHIRGPYSLLLSAGP
ncbi:MAG: hypothetical protein ABIR77_01475, partial [Sphingomicrobium sp.]